MKKQLKILNLIDIPWYSALTDYAFAQAKVLSEKGHKIYFGSDRNSLLWQKANEDGYQTIEITDRKKIITPFLIHKLIKFIKKENIDIINAHTGRTQTLAYIISHVIPKIKIIRMKSDAKKIKKSFTYSKISGIICGSKYLLNMYSNFKIKKEVIYKSINPPEYIPPSKDKPYKIGILGRLDPVKGHIYFIKSGIMLLENNYDCNFLIAGKEANLKWEQLKKLIPLKYQNKFFYLGNVNNIFKFIKNCHIGVISSVSSEAVSRAAVEWMACGRLLITTDVGSLPEYVDKKFTVKPENEHELYKKIRENLSFDNIISEGLKNLEKIKKEFSFENFRNKTLDFFENV